MYLPPISTHDMRLQYKAKYIERKETTCNSGAAWTTTNRQRRVSHFNTRAGGQAWMNLTTPP
jgi:hypothetical protein